ncbi:MAG: HD domain-containing protein [Lachnospiraceae bacterium]|nr:HD domain-containing protein [Lachnospiraceae bacterium]
MEYIRISQINLSEHIGERVFIKFLVRDAEVRKQKDGVTDFMTFNMVDKDDCVEAKIFGATSAHLEIVQNGTVCVAAADIKPYNKAPSGFSAIIYNIDIAGESSSGYINWADGLDTGFRVIEDALNDVIDTIYGQITCSILMEYWDKFSSWSAAKGMHHTALGGLMVHTSEVVSLCEMLGNYFNSLYYDDFVDIQLLKCGALLHDWGKIFELDVDVSSGATAYSVEASLGSHIMKILSEVDLVAYQKRIGYQTYRINEVNEQEPVKSDEQLNREIEQVRLLKHLVASHHGKLEWGSPVNPATPEAYILHTMDNMSAEMFKYNKEFKNLEAGKSTTSWANGELKTIYKDTTK